MHRGQPSLADSGRHGAPPRNGGIPGTKGAIRLLRSPRTAAAWTGAVSREGSVRSRRHRAGALRIRDTGESGRPNGSMKSATGPACVGNRSLDRVGELPAGVLDHHDRVAGNIRRAQGTPAPRSAGPPRSCCPLRPRSTKSVVAMCPTIRLGRSERQRRRLAHERASLRDAAGASPASPPSVQLLDTELNRLSTPWDTGARNAKTIRQATSDAYTDRRALRRPMAWRSRTRKRSMVARGDREARAAILEVAFSRRS